MPLRGPLGRLGRFLRPIWELQCRSLVCVRFKGNGSLIKTSGPYTISYPSYRPNRPNSTKREIETLISLLLLTTALLKTPYLLRNGALTDLSALSVGRQSSRTVASENRPNPELDRPNRPTESSQWSFGIRYETPLALRRERVVREIFAMNHGAIRSDTPSRCRATLARRCGALGALQTRSERRCAYEAG